MSQQDEETARRLQVVLKFVRQAGSQYDCHADRAPFPRIFWRFGDMTSKCIGLALSGGGYRALVFHLGVLARLASDNLLEEVSFVSTVSGGSLAAALIYATNDYRWPSSQAYLNQVIPEIRRFLPKHNLAQEIRSQILRNPPAWFRRGSNTLIQVLSSKWDIKPSIQAIPDHPRWIINATCYETSKNWRFMSRRMGDYDFGKHDESRCATCVGSGRIRSSPTGRSSGNRYNAVPMGKVSAGNNQGNV